MTFPSENARILSRSLCTLGQNPWHLSLKIGKVNDCDLFTQSQLTHLQSCRHQRWFCHKTSSLDAKPLWCLCNVAVSSYLDQNQEVRQSNWVCWFNQWSCQKNMPVLNTCWFFWQEGRKPLNNRTWFRLTKKVLTLHLHLQEVFQDKDNLLEALNAPTSPASSRPHLGMVSVFVRYPRTPDLSYSSLVMLIVVHNF